MDTLLDSLENLLDSLGDPNFEVEYHVSACYLLSDAAHVLKLYCQLVERCFDAQLGRQRHIRDQQAAAQ